jgi:alpha-D-xyloside xylohydrolase
MRTRPLIWAIAFLGCAPEVTTSRASFSALTSLGNAWHIPDHAEPGIPFMRDPPRGPIASTAIRIYSGNQATGPGGNPGTQAPTGSAVLYHVAGVSAWTEVPLVSSSQSGHNVYDVATLPAQTFHAGDLVEYYLRIAYVDHATTFVFGDDAQSTTTGDEATARAGAFSFTVDQPLVPDAGSDYVSFTVGAFEGRAYKVSGHFSVVGPDLAGTPKEIVFAPADVSIQSRWLQIGRILSSTVGPNGIDLSQSLGAGTVRARLSSSMDGVIRYEVIDWGGLVPDEIDLSASSTASEHFYGFGEKFDALEQSQKRVHILTKDAPGDKGDQSYKVAPWFISTRGYGVHLDSTAESWFDMRAAASDRYTIEHLYRSLAIDVVYGPKLTDVLSRYTALTGRPALPPKWAFAPWMSSDVWRSGGEVRYVVTKYRSLGIPGSVFVYDSPWEIAYNDFAWNMTQFGADGDFEGRHWDGFSSSAEMMSFLKQNGFKVIVWLTPFIDVRSNDEMIAGQNLGMASEYAEAQMNDYLVKDASGAPLVVTWWKGDGSPVDFTNASARSWFQSILSRVVQDSGGVIGGFKTDDGEADYVPLTARYADGRTGVEMRNGFCFEYQRAVSEVLGPQGVLWARCGFAGTQAFRGCWAGDNAPNFGTNNGLPTVIRAGQSAAMSGYSLWGSDVGGYQDQNPSLQPDDLFMRWTQFGALSPVMQMHRQIARGLQYPWSYSPAALANYLTYARLHVALFPYLYSYARASADAGLPIIRPLVLMSPTDPATFAIDDQYLLGEELLVAPVVGDNAQTRSVYLPQGGWYDFFTHVRHQGGGSVMWSNADQSMLPVFVREGAIVPMLPDRVDTLVDRADLPATSTLATASSTILFRVFPHADSSFVLYDDTHLDSSAAADGSSVKLTLTSTARSVRFEVLTSLPVIEVDRDGATLHHAASASELLQSGEGWIMSNDVADVRIHHGGGTTVITLWTTAPNVQPDAGTPISTDAGGLDAMSSDSGTAADAGMNRKTAESGCSCASTTPRRLGGLALALVLALGAFVRRRSQAMLSSS